MTIWKRRAPSASRNEAEVKSECGSGKSQLALDLLAQLTGYGVRFVFFDMKSELEDDPNNPQQRQTRSRFLEQAGARYVRLIQEDLPINPLIRHPNPTENAQVAYEIANLIRCFAPQLGPRRSGISGERCHCHVFRIGGGLPTRRYAATSGSPTRISRPWRW